MGELKFLNVETCKGQRTSDPKVNVNGKSGSIRINKAASEKLELSEKATIQVVLDGKYAYLLLNFEGGFSLRRGTEKDAGVLILQNSPCARGILKNFGMDEQTTYGFKIGEKTDLKGHEVYELKKQSVLE